MKLLTQHDDGKIGLHTENDGHYNETMEEFEADFGVALPALPDGITHRLYEPGVRHALQQGTNVVDGGLMPWPPGDDALDRADEIIAIKREEAVAAEAEARAKVKADAEAEMKAGTEKMNADMEVFRQEQDKRVAAFTARRNASLDKLAAVLQRAGASGQETNEIIDGLWPQGPAQ
jgi:hypothetical protein